MMSDMPKRRTHGLLGRRAALPLPGSVIERVVHHYDQVSSTGISIGDISRALDVTVAIVRVALGRWRPDWRNRIADLDPSSIRRRGRRKKVWPTSQLSLSPPLATPQRELAPPLLSVEKMQIPRTVEWVGDAARGLLYILDQTLLPAQRQSWIVRDVPGVIDAIRSLAVRGAPAIGIAGAYGCVLALRQGRADDGIEAIATARPTAVNLRWAVERVRRAAGGDPARALLEARAIHAEDAAACVAIGQHGAPLIKEGMGVLTHCNAGALATGGIGTALAPMYVAHRQGRRFKVYADETRPLLQGARLTAFELSEAGIDVTVLADNMAATLMRQGRVQLAIVGADRIALNGDTANKIGTYGVALIAKAHGVPLYVAAPRSTFDARTPDGAAIPIEERAADEMRFFNERQIAPEHAGVFNPAFDVTPAELIAGYVTEAGVITAAQIAPWLGA